MISVIIPTLNEERHLAGALDSIKKQAFKDYEVIIVDAGSTDNTKQAASGFNFVEFGEANVSRQRNLGASIAKGSILIFLDADVIIRDSDFFSRVNDIFSSKKISAAACKVRLHPNEEKLFDRLFFSFTDLITKIFRAGRGACQIVRKDRFPGYNERMAVGEDIDLFKRIKGKIQYLPGIVYESSRRYRKEGYAKIIWHWTLSWLLHSIGRPYAHKRKAVR